MITDLRERYNDITSKLSDTQLNKAGTIGTEPTATPNGKGGYDRGVQVKLGKVGAFTIPTGKIKDGVKKAVSTAKTVGQLAGAVATEPFTNKLVKEAGRLPDTKLTKRYPTNQ